MKCQNLRNENTLKYLQYFRIMAIPLLSYSNKSLKPIVNNILYLHFRLLNAPKRNLDDSNFNTQISKFSRLLYTTETKKVAKLSPQEVSYNIILLNLIVTQI